MKYIIDVMTLRLSIKEACDELFSDHDLKMMVYSKICGEVEDNAEEYGEKCDDN